MFIYGHVHGVLFFSGDGEDHWDDVNSPPPSRPFASSPLPASSGSDRKTSWSIKAPRRDRFEQSTARNTGDRFRVKQSTRSEQGIRPFGGGPVFWGPP